MALLIDILYMEDCTDWENAARAVQQALTDLGLEAEFQYWLVTNDRQAIEWNFIGSPSIRANGDDLFPPQRPASAGLKLRAYITEEGVTGCTTYAMCYEALSRFC